MNHDFLNVYVNIYEYTLPRRETNHIFEPLHKVFSTTSGSGLDSVVANQIVKII